MSKNHKSNPVQSMLPSIDAAKLSRRDLLRWSAFAGLSAVSAAVLPYRSADAQPTGHTATSTAASNGEPAPTTLNATPIRPPAVPLAVRQPYLSVWLPATLLPGTWPQFWQGSTTEMAGIVRIDGIAYVFMGDPKLTLNVPDGNHGKGHTIEDFPRALDQTALKMTPTRSSFELQGAGVALVVEFLSPVEPGDLKRQSMPLSYIHVSARSIDGQRHKVQLYMDIAGDWVSGDHKQPVTWQLAKANGMEAWTLRLDQPRPLTEQKQFAAWGNIVWATRQHPRLSVQSGEGTEVRGQFARHGTLSGSNDGAARTIGKHPPVLGLSIDLDRLDASATRTTFCIGHVRNPAINYLGKPLAPLWMCYFKDWQDMLAFFHRDANAASERADALDTRIVSDAREVGGRTYEGLCSLALRQAYGGTELVQGPDGTPWGFIKEISSDGNVSTVDIAYPAAPVWIYLDPGYLKLLLTPLLAYAEKGGWPKAFAEHDLGASYPNATGHNDGKEEDMPVEESGNMLILAAAYLRRAPTADAKAFAAAHYGILEKWAGYLTRNLPDPGFQNQTDDFAGSIAHSVNLAIKGIVAVAAMGQIATAAGRSAQAEHYRKLAEKYMTFWTDRACDPSANHLDLTYNGAGGGDGTWGTLYNGFADQLLGTGLIPDAIRKMQAAWYVKTSNPFGLPLQVPHSYAKTDWALFTAAWLSDEPIKQQLIDRVYAYANTTPQRVPFSDLYSTLTGHRVAFKARPVQGGIFAPLALKATTRSS